MPIDYSKWDKIELSDDEDFDCHPNIDKASFVRFKQREIHRQRQERRERIQQLEANTPVNKELVLMLKKIIDKKPKFDEISELISGLKEKSRASSSSSEKVTLEEMLIRLITDVGKEHKDGCSEEWFTQTLQGHLDKLQEVMVQEEQELKKLLDEQARKVTMDDLHVTHERSVLLSVNLHCRSSIRRMRKKKRKRKRRKRKRKCRASKSSTPRLPITT